jgi:Protein of unknown function (DUF3108)
MDRWAFFLLAALAVAAPARAGEIDAAYSANWVGLPAAEIKLAFRRDGATAETEIAIATKGLPRWLTKFRADAVDDVQIAPDGVPLPRRYRALYDLRKRRNSRIDLRFVDEGGVSTVERTPDDTTRKPPLAAPFRRNVVDPLAALAVIQAALDAHRGETRTFVVPVFDGARRFDVVTDVTQWDKQNRQVRVTLNLRPIAGFKGESSDDPDPDSAPRPVDVVFSDDAALTPVSLKVSIAYLPLVVRFDHLCKSFATCGD